MEAHDKIRFEQLVLPHLDSAVNLARWLLRNRDDAEDVVQEAMLRAYRFFAQFRGSDARAWLLQIVRNTSYSWMEKHRSSQLSEEFNEERHESPAPSADALVGQSDDRRRLTAALDSLPPRWREVVVLRELEGCSYKEIADIAGIPIGTVMSTLSRARERLLHALTHAVAKEAS